MAHNEGSHLKRSRHSQGDQLDAKKPRRSERLVSQRVPSTSSLITEVGGPTASKASKASKPPKAPKAPKTPASHRQQQQQLLTPNSFLTTEDALTDTEQQRTKELTATPPGGGPSHVPPRGSNGDAGGSADELIGSYSSPPNDTQAIPSQLIDPNAMLSDEVVDEVKEGVWGYLLPLNVRYGTRSIVMKRRAHCGDDAPTPGAAATAKKGSSANKGAKKKPAKDASGSGSGSSSNGDAKSIGYLIGRHPECDVVVEDLSISNRHCIIFAEHKDGNDTVAVIEDTSTNGTFVNDALLGRNRRRELHEGDEIAVLDARFVFRYPRCRTTSGFHQQYAIRDRLGKGHFAEVYRCVEKATGHQFAVKVFSKTPGMEDLSKTEGLQQEIAVLMGVSHPNILCLKDTFDERNAVYLVLELASGGELFNYILEHQKLNEADTRRLFKQLFAGVKYLHDRNIVHRDIKPENILLVDNNLHAKLADFGLAKIIGEESFTTTLCGTPSYVAPEILADSRNRMYSKAVDVWSLGVVLYICLCGFPPFSDELYSPPQFPYRLAQQILGARFTFPSPYWDSVGDPALDLIDKMLVVDPGSRLTIEQCMAHPWMTATSPTVNDSTDGLVGGVAGLAVGRRTGHLSRERTLLSAHNRAVAPPTAARGTGTGGGSRPINIVNKNGGGHVAAETRPADDRDPGEFMELGGRGDPVLFDDEASTYDRTDVTGQKKGKGTKR